MILEAVIIIYISGVGFAANRFQIPSFVNKAMHMSSWMSQKTFQIPCAPNGILELCISWTFSSVPSLSHWPLHPPTYTRQNRKSLIILISTPSPCSVIWPFKYLLNLTLLSLSPAVFFPALLPSSLDRPVHFYTLHSSLCSAPQGPVQSTSHCFPIVLRINIKIICLV